VCHVGISKTDLLQPFKNAGNSGAGRIRRPPQSKLPPGLCRLKETNKVANKEDKINQLIKRRPTTTIADGVVAD
jgi:hypothetical protein